MLEDGKSRSGCCTDLSIENHEVKGTIEEEDVQAPEINSAGSVLKDHSNGTAGWCFVRPKYANKSFTATVPL